MNLVNTSPIFRPHMSAFSLPQTKNRYTYQLYMHTYTYIYLGYRLRGHKGERNNCFSKIQLVDEKKYRDKTSFAS